jgi:hypothetical protein
VIVNLKKTYKCQFGAPEISKIDDEIFRERTFAFCMEFGACKDSCCSYGVDIDIENIKRLKKYQRELEKYVGRPASEWFEKGMIKEKEFPGGKYTRTKTFDNKCVFLNRKGPGCLIHKFCLEKGINVHILKPMVSLMFPVTFDYGLLHASNEITMHSLACLTNKGPTLYQGAKEDLRFYFGEEFIEELDQIEKSQLKVQTESAFNATLPISQ